ncbi:MAG: hypothetical protein C5B52_01585 [Bacteroidetes bacterium]|nr:MAG: hypothetical protein C5B52_01585 [Bacteroidota bacterium]
MRISIDHIKWQRIILLIVLAYEALGAMTGGLLLIMKPDGKFMDMPVNLMHGTFLNFLMPGIILTAMGILSALAFVLLIRRKQNDWLWACIALGGWFIWFYTEIIILQELHWLHLMWAVPVLIGIIVVIPLVIARNNTDSMLEGLLYCGVLSSLWYVFVSVYVPFYYVGYTPASQTVSELSSYGAPTRILWVLLATFYPLLFGAFGWGVFYTAENNKRLRIAAGFIIAYSVFNFYWPPMDKREVISAVGRSLNDSLHIGWTIVTMLLAIAIMTFSAGGSGKKFRIYTSISIMLMIVFGILTAKDTPALEANLPTPMMGIWERASEAVYFLWVMALAVKLLYVVRQHRLVQI